MPYDLTPRVGDSAHQLLFKIAAATSDVANPPDPDESDNQLLRRIAAATAAGAGGGAGGGAAWGAITGTLSAQTDLQTALDAKVSAAGGAFTGLTGAGFRDTSAAFDATLGFTSSTALTQARALTFDLVNGSRTFKMAGNVDLGGAFTTTGSGTIALGGFTFTVPATGTAALRGVANTFTAAQTFNADVSLGASAGFTNLGGNSGAVLWQRQDVNMVMFHGQGFNSVGIGAAGYLPGVIIGSSAVLGFSSGIPAAGTDLTVRRASAGGALQIDGGCIVLAGTRTGAALTLSQTWNNAGVTCRGLELAVTNTNSASGSTLLRILGGAAGATQALALSALHGSLSVGTSSNSATISLQGSDRVATAALGAFGNEFMFSSTQLAANNVALRFTDANTVVRYGTIYGETTDVLALRNGSGGTTGAAWEMLEMTAPGTPSADRLRLYVEDNGSGKTRLVVKFSDGTTAVLATQP
jgi:hypothetical protein